MCEIEEKTMIRNTRFVYEEDSAEYIWTVVLQGNAGGNSGRAQSVGSLNRLRPFLGKVYNSAWPDGTVEALRRPVRQ